MGQRGTAIFSTIAVILNAHNGITGVVFLASASLFYGCHMLFHVLL